MIFLRSVAKFFEKTKGRAAVKFIITSRPYNSIEDAFLEEYPDVPSVRLTGEGEEGMAIIQKEISLVIEKKINHFREKRQQKGVNDDVCSLLSNQINGIKNCTYLWVSLIFPELFRKAGRSRSVVFKEIEKIPTDVERAYDRMLNECNDPAKARKLLHFLLVAKRPLTLEETNVALALEESSKSIKDLELEPAATFCDIIRELCSLLVSIVDSKIYFIHQTAREFLVVKDENEASASRTAPTWMHSMDLKISNLEFTRTCVKYLQIFDFEVEMINEIINERNLLAIKIGRIRNYYKRAKEQKVCRKFDEAYPFLSYAARFWSRHARKAELQNFGSIMTEMLKLTELTTKNSRNRGAIMTLFGLLRFYDVDAEELHAYRSCQLPLVALLGPNPLLRSLLAKKPKSSWPQDVFSTATFTAIGRSCEAFKILNDEGLDLELKNRLGSTLLGQAVEAEKVETVKFLLKAGAQVNSRDYKGITPLIKASRICHKGLFNLLIQSGADVAARSNSEETVLHHAAAASSSDPHKLIDVGTAIEVKKPDR
ncbi:hypothetical protein MMC28_011619 [Mycoblastus sanguinarius]|nr:hypothetical protein [Mycoblastus sanguinarius]